MAFDGAFLYKTVEELKSAIDCHIEKIYQPSRDELVISLRKKGFNKKLYISARSGAQRIQFTENKTENPATPPMFCMLLRKHLASARLIDIVQPSLERVVSLVFSAANEMGDIVEIKLICELIGAKSNIILVNSGGKIIDALRHSSVEAGGRLILPTATYRLPENREKLNPLLFSANEIVSRKADRTYLEFIEGFSPLICREIENAQNQTNALEKVLISLKSDTTPVMIYSENGEPFDFTYTEIKQYGEKYKIGYFESFSSLLDEFYRERENISRINTAARDIIKLVTNLKQRAQKRLALRLNDLAKCENREYLRIYGELIKANLYSIEKGSSVATVPNYYSENMETVNIPLDISISPADNANKYFKEYKKTYTAEQSLKELTQKDREEIEYFESVLDSIERSSGISDIALIREELIDGGYIKTATVRKKITKDDKQFKEYTSDEGYKILVGKNNRQNDYITTCLANKSDLWFHVKNIPGSHVVVFSGGKEVSDATVLKAAALAAKNSKAAASSNVAVDYTPIKFVKKPHGAKPGMVIYTTNKTVYVTPEGD